MHKTVKVKILNNTNSQALPIGHSHQLKWQGSLSLPWADTPCANFVNSQRQVSIQALLPDFLNDPNGFKGHYQSYNRRVAGPHPTKKKKLPQSPSLPKSGHIIPPIPGHLETPPSLQETQYKPYVLLRSLLFFTFLVFSLPINLMCDVCCVLWLCGIPWLPTTRMRFHLSCAIYATQYLSCANPWAAIPSASQSRYCQLPHCTYEKTEIGMFKNYERSDYSPTTLSPGRSDSSPCLLSSAYIPGLVWISHSIRLTIIHKAHKSAQIIKLLLSLVSLSFNLAKIPAGFSV